jgi:hypothetical protein
MWLTQEARAEIPTESERALERIEPQYDVTSTFIVVKVNTYTTADDVMKDFLVKSKGMYKNPEFTTLHGFSNMRFRPSVEVALQGDAFDHTLYVCEMNVVKPVYYYDNAWYTMGHELGHCLYGIWHDRSLTPVDNAE